MSHILIFELIFFKIFIWNIIKLIIFKIDNGIPILSYYNNDKDNELLELENYLIKISEFDDLRDANNFFLKLHDFRHYEEPINIIKNVFFDYLWYLNIILL